MVTPIRDSRLTDLCAVVSRSGIQGSNIFRADDPVFTEIGDVPRHWNCRCNVQPLAVAEAGRLGINEAQLWDETGVRPETPAFVEFPKLTGEAADLWNQWKTWKP